MQTIRQSLFGMTNPTQTQFLYGFTQGTLRRYRPIKDAAGQTTGYRSAGAVAGFGDVRGLALIASDARKDVFLATTRTGALLTVTVPTTSPMRTSAARLRNTGWKSYRALVPTTCGNTVVVMAVDDRGYGRVFTVGRLAGLRTTVTAAPRTVDVRGLRALAPGTQMP